MLFVGAPLIGGLISPWVYKLATQIPSFDYPFYRVWSRCVMLTALFLIRPAYKLVGFKSVAEIGLPHSKTKLRVFGKYALIGALSMMALYAIGLWVGAYNQGSVDWSTGRYIYKITTYILGALLVGIWEEIFFRGVIFSALRKSCGLICALFFGSIIFAAPDTVQVYP